MFRLVLFVILLSPFFTFAQNTKGDKPAPSRESRFRTPYKDGDQKKRKVVTAKKRVPSKEKSVAGRAKSFVNAKNTSSWKGQAREADPTNCKVTSHRTNRKPGVEISPDTGYGLNHLLEKAERISIRSMVDMSTILRRSQNQPKKQYQIAAHLRQLKIYKRPEGGGSPPKRRKVVPRSASGSFHCTEEY